MGHCRIRQPFALEICFNGCPALLCVCVTRWRKCVDAQKWHGHVNCLVFTKNTLFTSFAVQSLLVHVQWPTHTVHAVSNPTEEPRE